MFSSIALVCIELLKGDWRMKSNLSHCRVSRHHQVTADNDLNNHLLRTTYNIENNFEKINMLSKIFHNTRLYEAARELVKQRDLDKSNFELELFSWLCIHEKGVGVPVIHDRWSDRAEVDTVTTVFAPITLARPGDGYGYGRQEG